jgi:hypothetical protein
MTDKYQRAEVDEKKKESFPDDFICGKRNNNNNNKPTVIKYLSMIDILSALLSSHRSGRKVSASGPKTSLL